MEKTMELGTSSSPHQIKEDENSGEYVERIGEM
jgi:hypothetical protein